jgi:hypothetical protein
MTATIFTVDSTNTILTIAATANDNGIGLTLSPQGSSSINSSETSLQTHYTGTISVAIGASSIQFLSGNSIVASNNGLWQPGSNPDPSGGNPGNFYQTELADYGATASLLFIGTEMVAARGLVFDVSSSTISGSASAGYPLLNNLSITSTAGNVYYDGISGAIGTTALAGEQGLDQTTQNATLTSSGTTQTLTIPIDATYTQLVTASVSVTLHYTGVFVAHATLAAPLSLSGPTDYLKLDGDGQDVDIWNNSTATGSPTQIVSLSQTSSMSVTGTSGNTNLTIDFSNGDPLVPAGLTYTGASGGNNVLNIIGDNNNDGLAATSSSITLSSVFGSAAITYNNVGHVVFAAGSGTDSLSVSSGAVTLAAPKGGGGVVPQKFSSVSIAAGATFALATASSHTDRTVLLTSSLSIAGSTGNWTGTLDLGGNDLVVHNADAASALAMSATLTNQARSGLNVGKAPYWGGPGLNSSWAAADPLTIKGIGILVNNNGTGGRYFGNGAPRGPFDGQDLATTDVVLKTTFFGDADLSGSINSSDFSLVDNGTALHLSGWSNGDFNYDGTVNAADYSLIDTAFAFQSSSGAPLNIPAQTRTTPSAEPTEFVQSTPSVPWPLISSYYAQASPMRQQLLYQTAEL